MNSCNFIGRLTRDPEIRYSQGANPICIARFTLAVDRKGGEKTDFLTMKALGKGGEFVEKYLHKGTKILLGGEVQNNNYKDKDGVTHYSVSIVVDEIEFAESKSQNNNSASNNTDFMSVPEGVEEQLPFN